MPIQMNAISSGVSNDTTFNCVVEIDANSAQEALISDEKVWNRLWIFLGLSNFPVKKTWLQRRGLFSGPKKTISLTASVYRDIWKDLRETGAKFDREWESALLTENKTVVKAPTITFTPDVGLVGRLTGQTNLRSGKEQLKDAGDSIKESLPSQTNTALLILAALVLFGGGFFAGGKR